MKKVLALFLVLVMSVPSLLVFAETAESDIHGYATEQIVANDSSAQYATDTVYTRYFNHSATPVFRIANNGITTAPASNDYGKWQLSGSLVVYKIPLPELTSSQLIDEFNFHHATGASNAGHVRVVKLPGEGWETISGITTSHTDVKYAIDNCTGLSKANDTDLERAEFLDSNSSRIGWRVKANITSYAKECLAKNQDYMYVALYCKYTEQSYGYELTETKYHPTISFKLKAYEGLETVKETISYTKQYVVSSNLFATYTSNHGIKKDVSYLMYELPLPTLTSTQKIVDYKLYLYHHNDVLGTGYGKLVAYKDNNGAQRITNSSNLTSLPLSDVIADNQVYHEKGVKAYNGIKLTSYAKELTASSQTKMYVAITTGESNSSTFACDSLSNNYPPYVEYIIHDSNGIYSGNEVSELKIVASASDRYNAQNMTNLAVGTAYRAVAKAYNYDSSSVDTNMYVALYNGDNELAKLLVLPCKITSKDSDIMIWSDEFVPDAETKNVKAFLWTANTLAPLSVSKTSAVLQ
ncbi:MAG: hypothetical protein II998_00195 [Clostridia bacterium]|nr:hypothetical protein [Clostridia bacterium]